MNYWLVSKGLKHGMVTSPKEGEEMHMQHTNETASPGEVTIKMWISLGFLALGCLIALIGWFFA